MVPLWRLVAGIGHSEGYLRVHSGVLDSVGGLAGGSTIRGFSFDFDGELMDDAGVLYSLFEVEDEEDDIIMGCRGERRTGEVIQGLGRGSWSL